MPDFKKIVEDAGDTLGKWTYLVVGVMAFFETGAFVGLIAPGETFLIFGGVVAGQGTISLVVLIAITWTCAVLGDLALLRRGRASSGAGSWSSTGPRCRSPRSASTRSRASSSATAARRSSSAGSSASCARSTRSWPGRRGCRCGASCPTTSSAPARGPTMLLVLGYVFWQSFDQVLQWAERGTLALGTVIVVLAALFTAYRHFRVEENRDRAAAWTNRQLDRPALRPVAFFVRPIGRWAQGAAEVLLEPHHAGRARAGADDAADLRRGRVVRARRQRDRAARPDAADRRLAPRAAGPTRSGPTRSTTSRARSRTSAR